MTLTDREMDIRLEEIKAENARLIEDYLLYVMRPRDVEAPAQEQQAQLQEPVIGGAVPNGV